MATSSSTTRQSYLERLLQGSTHPIVGMGFILEMWDKVNPSKPTCQCILCNFTGEPKFVAAHMKSAAHKLAYMKALHHADYREFQTRKLSMLDMENFLSNWAAKKIKNLKPQAPIVKWYSSRPTAAYAPEPPPMPSTSNMERIMAPPKVTLAQVVLSLQDRNRRGETFESQEEADQALDAIDSLVEHALSNHFASFAPNHRELFTDLFKKSRRNHLMEKIEKSKSMFEKLKETLTEEAGGASMAFLPKDFSLKSLSVENNVRKNSDLMEAETKDDCCIIVD